MNRAKRSLGTSLVTAAITVAALVWWVNQPSQMERVVSQEPGGTLLRMVDYNFAPKTMVWKVGQRVSLTLVNDSQSSPPRAHEFMVGRDPRWAGAVVGRLPQDGFATDFFEGVQVSVREQVGVQMLMPGMATVTGMSPTPTATGMPGMPGMPGMSPTPTATGMPGMASFMVVLKGGGQVTLDFTVPDLPGTWTFACFQQSGQHFLNGMSGQVTVVR